MRFPRKKSSSILTISIILASVLLTSSFVSTTTLIHNAAHAQRSNTGFGETTYLALPNGKSIPVKYIINTGKVLGVVLDKSRATLDVILSSTPSSDNGNLTIQIPRDVVDNKNEGNADAPFRMHVDGKDATFKETDNNKTTRTLSIQFSKDAKVIDIIGSTSRIDKKSTNQRITGYSYQLDDMNNQIYISYSKRSEIVYLKISDSVDLLF